MITKSFLFIFLFGFSILVSAQDMPEYAFFKIPKALLDDAREVVRQDFGEFTVISEEKGVGKFKKVVTLLNEKSKADELYFSYSNQVKVGHISIRIFDAFGNLVRKVKSSDLSDHSAIDGFSIYLDERYKYYRASHTSYPFTIEYSYESTYSGTAFASFPNWYVQPSFYCSVENSTFVVKLPKGMKFHYEVLNIEKEVTLETEMNMDVYSWSFQQLPALLYEEDMPVAGKVFPVIMTAPDHFKIDQYEGGMSTWEEFSGFVKKLYAGRDKLPEELVEKIKGLTEGASSDVEKIKILYRYLQENMRYVSVQLGLGGWQPFDAEYVYRNKYGDCKALTNYMYAMLTEVGVDARPALIGSGDRNYQASEAFATSYFNHVILYVPSENYWLECTSTDFPPNYIGLSNANRYALLIQETGGHLVKTPELAFDKNVQESKTVINFRSDGSAEIEQTIKATGSKHEIFRAIENQLSETETKTWLERSTAIPSASFSSFHVATEKNAPQSTFSYQAQSRRYGSRAGKRIFLPLNVINIYEDIPPGKENRIHPVVINEGFIELDTIVFMLPEGYAVESVPNENVSLENDYAHFSMTVEQHPGQLILTRKLELHRKELPPEQYTTYRNFFKQIAKADNMKAVLVQE